MGVPRGAIRDRTHRSSDSGPGSFSGLVGGEP
jgi:hypothetical protein